MKSFLHGVKNYIYILWDGYKYNILNMFLKLEKLAGIGLLCLLHWGKIGIAIRRSYGEYFMRYIVSSIAIVSMICSISIDLYMKLVIDDFEKIILEYLRGGYK